MPPRPGSNAMMYDKDGDGNRRPPNSKAPALKAAGDACTTATNMSVADESLRG